MPSHSWEGTNIHELFLARFITAAPAPAAVERRAVESRAGEKHAERKKIDDGKRSW
jgi:hypothetical protein